MPGDLPSWLTDTKPMVICGTTGAGKTTLARCFSHVFPGVSLFFDLDEEPAMGTEVRSVDELDAALARGERRICIRAGLTDIRDPDLFPEVVQYLMDLGNDLRGSDAGPVLFAFDELQDLQEKWVTVAQKRLRKRRIKPVGYSQDPVSVPTRARTVAEYNGWLSPPPSKMRDSIQAAGYPVDLLEKLDEYDLLVMGDGWEPVGRYRAPAEYARE
jgi:energy-coupling factor transporter ATP-binding protein EcfA2